MSSGRTIIGVLGIAAVCGVIGCGSVALSPDGGGKTDDAASDGSSDGAADAETITLRLVVSANKPYCDVAMGAR